MAKYVAVGVLAVIVLAALTYESPEQQKTAQATVNEELEGAYGGETPAETTTPAGPLSERVAEVVAEVAARAAEGGEAEEAPAGEPAPEPTPTASTTSNDEGSAGKFIKHTVAKGETLSDVAKAMLGSGKRWREVYDYNRERIGESPNHVRVGLTLVFPADKAQTLAASATPTVASVTATHTNGRSYTVQKGDTLYGIARSQLGSGTRWKEIASLNGLDGAELVAGKTLALPTR